MGYDYLILIFTEIPLGLLVSMLLPMARGAKEEANMLWILLAFDMMLSISLDALQDHDSIAQKFCHNHLSFHLKHSI